MKIMNFNFFSSRNKKNADKKILLDADVSTQRIDCDTKELKTLIINFTESRGWEFDDFATFLEQIGIKTPVKVNELCNNSFKCITALGTEIYISLEPSYLDIYSEIKVSAGKEIKSYAINTNSYHKPKKEIPRVSFQSLAKEVSNNQMTLSCLYKESRIWEWELTLDKSHTLKIRYDHIVNIDEDDDETFENFISINCKNVENYLLKLNNSLALIDVSTKTLKLLGFYNSDSSIWSQFSISYIEKVNTKETILNRISLTQKNIQEFELIDNGQKFHLFKNKNWEYSCNGIEIFYDKKSNNYELSITGSMHNIKNITKKPSEIIKHAETKMNAKINKLQKSLFL